jgi:hypothetical protein
MARRKGGAADSPTEQSATAVLGDEVEEQGVEETPIFPDSKADPEPEQPAEEMPEVVYVPKEAVLPADESKPKVDDATKAKNLGTALQHEREHGKRLRDELRSEREKSERAEAEATRLRHEQTRSDNRKKLEDAQDLTEALPAIKNEIAAELEPGIIAARRGVIRMSQKFARKEYVDYDDVLTQSGVADGIAIDPSTGKPKDPVMWKKIILMSEDPGEDAYSLGLSILDERGVSVTPTHQSDVAASTSVRPVIEMRPTADRFGGVRRLAPSAGREPRRLSDSDIEKMSESEYGALPKHVREAYLAGGRV